MPDIMQSHLPDSSFSQNLFIHSSDKILFNWFMVFMKYKFGSPLPSFKASFFLLVSNCLKDVVSWSDMSTLRTLPVFVSLNRPRLYDRSIRINL